MTVIYRVTILSLLPPPAVPPEDIQQLIDDDVNHVSSLPAQIYSPHVVNLTVTMLSELKRTL